MIYIYIYIYIIILSLYYLMIPGMAQSWIYGRNMAMEIEAAAAEVRDGTEKVPCRWSEKRSTRSVSMGGLWV